jgi:polyvinyl alcohol dehydrogenase (cytochrome)
MNESRWMVLALAGLLGACSSDEKTESGAPEGVTNTPWTVYGGGLEATRQSPDTTLSRDNVANLQLKWEVPLRRCTTTPAVDRGIVYFADWAGSVHAHRVATGQHVWSTRVGGFATDDSPLLMDGRLFIGDAGATLHSLDQKTGKLLWSTKLDPVGSSHLYSSPIGFDGKIYIGVASTELIAAKSDYEFRGSIARVDAVTGKIDWQTYVTENNEVSGAGCSVWSSFAIDANLRRGYIGVGQNYEKPVSPYSDSLISVNLDSGEIVWHRQFTAEDAFVIARPQGPDFDIGASPNLFTVNGRDLVGVGDKGGMFAVFDRVTGDPAWDPIRVSNGSATGGVMDSAAYHDGVLFVASNHITTSGIDDPKPSDVHVLMAINAADGTTKWEKQKQFLSVGGLTWANGLVFNMSTDGTLYAVDANNGDQLWSAVTGDVAAGGVSVADGMVFACNGFAFFKSILGGKPITGKMVAFGLP